MSQTYPVVYKDPTGWSAFPLTELEPDLFSYRAHYIVYHPDTNSWIVGRDTKALAIRKSLKSAMRVVDKEFDA